MVNHDGFIQVVVPQGVYGGNQLTVEVEGQFMNVTVPTGLRPGQLFHVNPAPPVVHAQPGIALGAPISSAAPVPAVMDDIQILKGAQHSPAIVMAVPVSNSYYAQNYAQNAPINAAPQQLSSIQAGNGSESWGETYSCLSQPLPGCLYVTFCHCCAVCDMGDMIGDQVMVGLRERQPAPNFFNCPSQIQNLLTYLHVYPFIPIGLCIGMVTCPDKTWCIYDANMLKATAVALNKSSASPGPCDDPFWQMCCPCTAPCTFCLMYHELKQKRRIVELRPAHGPLA